MMYHKKPIHWLIYCRLYIFIFTHWVKKASQFPCKSIQFNVYIELAWRRVSINKHITKIVLHVDENAYALFCVGFLFFRLSIERFLAFVTSTECVEILTMSHWTSNNNNNYNSYTNNNIIFSMFSINLVIDLAHLYSLKMP